MIGLLAAVWFSFGQNVLGPDKIVNMPERLGTLVLTGTIEGAEALARVDRLHGSDIELSDAYIVEYLNDEDRASVWVGRTGTEQAAAELTQMMLQGIAKGGSGFENIRRLNINGQAVFQVDGPSGEHFFYHSQEHRENVVWLTVNAEDARFVLEQTVESY